MEVRKQTRLHALFYTFIGLAMALIIIVNSRETGTPILSVENGLGLLFGGAVGLGIYLVLKRAYPRTD
ncbi:MAG: hypothetical protein AAGE01_12850 [Pseudomonadota bacterium]